MNMTGRWFMGFEVMEMNMTGRWFMGFEMMR